MILEGNEIEARAFRELREDDRCVRIRALRGEESTEDELVSVVTHGHPPDVGYTRTSNF
jgi:hypothetical protein